MIASIQLVERDDLIDDGPSGKRPAEESGQAIDEATFAKQLAHRLSAAALKQEFTDLILMADPRALGQLRPQLHNETTRRIIREVAKTFPTAPVEDFESAPNHWRRNRSFSNRGQQPSSARASQAFSRGWSGCVLPDA